MRGPNRNNLKPVVPGQLNAGSTLVFSGRRLSHGSSSNRRDSNGGEGGGGGGGSERRKSTRSNDSAKSSLPSNNDGTVIERMPLFDFLEIPEALHRQFHVPSGANLTEQ